MTETTTNRNTRIFHSDAFEITNSASSSSKVTRRSKRRGAERKTDTQSMATDFLLDGLESDDTIKIADDFDLVAKTTTSRERRSSSDLQSPIIETDVVEGENAALLIEIDGVYTWRFPSEEKTSPKRRGSSATRTLVFSLSESAKSDGGARRGRRGLMHWITDQVIDRARAIVIKYIAGKAVSAASRYLERNIKPGLIHIVDDDVLSWKASKKKVTINLPPQKPVKVLLLIHGTFSSTLGSFGALKGSASGQKLIAGMLEKYDVVLAYDHSTLGEWPTENARSIHKELKRLGFPKNSELDVICFSRGGLVARKLIEDLLVEDNANLDTKSAVFVGCTNGGTALADPENWKIMLDMFTNLGVAAGKGLAFLGPKTAGTIITESVKTLSTFMQAIVDAGVTEEMVPGISAMSPHSSLVRELNDLSKIPDDSMIDYHIIGSNFEPTLFNSESKSSLSKKLLHALVDIGADTLMLEANDLVVDTEGMQQLGKFGYRIKNTRIWDANAIIYHTNYFAQPDVAKAITKWLIQHDDPHALESVGEPSPIEVSGDKIASEVLNDVQLLDEDDLVVIERKAYGHYVRSAGNIRDSLKEADVSKNLVDALNLHEWELAIAEHEPLENLRTISATGNVRFEYDTLIEAIAPPLPPLDNNEFKPEPSPKSARGANPGAGPVRAKPRRRRGVTIDRDTVDYESDGGNQDSLYVDTRGAKPTHSPLAKCNFAAQMQGAPDLKKPANIEVTVSREEIMLQAEMEGGKESALVKTDEQINIVVTAVHNCAMVGSEQEELFIPAVGKPEIYEFQVKGSAPGRAEIHVDARQGARRLCRIVLQPEFANHQELKASTIMDVNESELPSLQLRIVEFADGGTGPFSLLYILECRELGIKVESKTHSMTTPKEKYLGSLYEKLEGEWGSGKNFASLMLSLRGFGAALFDELVPIEIRQEIWKHRDVIGSIEVMSSEPSIPWELLHIKEPDGILPFDGNKFLAELGLVRWISNAGWPPVSLNVREGKIHHVIPEYDSRHDQLPTAPKERQMMERLFSSQQLEAGSMPILRFLSEPGTCDLLHFTCHGSADSNKIWEAGLLMSRSRDEKTGEMIENKIYPQDITQYANFSGDQGSQPLIFLNSCQTGKTGQGITGTGGMANAFIRKGAGLFIGSLWSIGDSVALTFAEVFYTSLLEGKTVTQAAHDARKASKQSEEPTWLAYSIHGNPNARLTQE